MPRDHQKASKYHFSTLNSVIHSQYRRFGLYAHFYQKSPNHLFNHQSPLNRIRIKDLNFYSHYTKNHLHTHLLKDIIAIYFHDHRLSISFSKLSTPLPYNHQTPKLLKAVVYSSFSALFAFCPIRSNPLLTSDIITT